MSRLHVFKRCFHTAAVLCKFKPKQPYVPPMLQKMINKGKNKRWDAPPNSSLPGIGRRITENSKRRAQFLGPILFRNIKEFFVTGELDDDYDLTVVEILRVQVTPDLSTAHVYWKATATEVDNEMQTLLNSTSGKIRHLLATYGVLNKVPQIVFVKDIAEAKHLEMLELLKQADMGDDYKWSEIFGTMKELDKMKKPEISDITKIGERFASGSHTDVTYLGNEQYSGHQSSGDVNTHSFNFTFQNDLYGIQHDTLMNKLIALKQRKKKRNIEENTQEENLTLDNMSKMKPHEGISKHLKMLQRKENEKPKKDKYDYISNMPKTLPLTHQAILMSNNRESSGQDNDESGDEKEKIENDLDYSDEELDEQHIFDEEIDDKYIEEWVSDDELDKRKSDKSSSFEEIGNKYIDELSSSSDEEIDRKYDYELSSSDEESDSSSSSDEETDDKHSSDKESKNLPLSDDGYYSDKESFSESCERKNEESTKDSEKK